MGVRGSLKAADAVVISGFGKLEGIAKVEDCRFMTVQYQQGEKKGGNLVTPFLAMQTDEIYVDKEGKPEDPEAQVEVVNHILCWGSKETFLDTGLHAFRFQPANIKSASDQEPVEVGTTDIDGDEKMKLVEIGAEGNTFVSIDGANPFANSDLMIFLASLEKAGFKPEVNAEGYAQNYKGLVYQFVTVPKMELCKELGIKAEPRKDGKAETARKVTAILVRPYEAKGGTKVAAAKAGTAKVGGKTAGQAAGSGAGTSDENQAKIDAAVETFIGTVKGKQYTKNKFLAAVGAALIKAVPMNVATPFINGLKKEDEFAGFAMANGLTVEGDQVTVDA